MLKSIHVDPAQISRNEHKRKRLGPPMVVRSSGGEVLRGFEVEICGPSKLVYRPLDPLPGGARVWIETEGKVILDGVTTLE